MAQMLKRHVRVNGASARGIHAGRGPSCYACHGDGPAVPWGESVLWPRDVWVTGPVRGPPSAWAAGRERLGNRGVGVLDGTVRVGFSRTWLACYLG